MIPGHIDGSQVTLGKPKDWDDARDGICSGLPVYVERLESGTFRYASVWFPTPEELTALAAGAPVKLWVLGSHPPVMLGVGDIPGDC